MQSYEDNQQSMSQFSLCSGYSQLQTENEHDTDTLDRERKFLEKDMERVNRMIRDANILYITQSESTLNNISNFRR